MHIWYISNDIHTHALFFGPTDKLMSPNRRSLQKGQRIYSEAKNISCLLIPTSVFPLTWLLLNVPRHLLSWCGFEVCSSPHPTSSTGALPCPGWCHVDTRRHSIMVWRDGKLILHTSEFPWALGPLALPWHPPQDVQPLIAGGSSCSMNPYGYLHQKSWSWGFSWLVPSIPNQNDAVIMVQSIGSADSNFPMV